MDDTAAGFGSDRMRRSIRGWGSFGLFEPDAAVVGLVMDLEAVLVDDDVVVVPAENALGLLSRLPLRLGHNYQPPPSLSLQA